MPAANWVSKFYTSDHRWYHWPRVIAVSFKPAFIKVSAERSDRKGRQKVFLQIIRKLSVASIRAWQCSKDLVQTHLIYAKYSKIKITCQVNIMSKVKIIGFPFCALGSVRRAAKSSNSPKVLACV